MGLTRRDVLVLFGCLGPANLVAQGGGLADFAMSGPPCTPDQRVTPAVPVDRRTYKPGAPVRASLAEPNTGAIGLALQGTVAGITCGRIKDADVEIWHSDNRGAYDMNGFRYRGRQITNASGQFSFQTIVPGSTSDRARHIGLHVRVPNKAELWTELFFPNESDNARDPRYKPELTMTVRSEARGRVATFDVLLNL